MAHIHIKTNNNMDTFGQGLNDVVKSYLVASGQMAQNQTENMQNLLRMQMINREIKNQDREYARIEKEDIARQQLGEMLAKSSGLDDPNLEKLLLSQYGQAPDLVNNMLGMIQQRKRDNMRMSSGGGGDKVRFETIEDGYGNRQTVRVSSDGRILGLASEALEDVIKSQRGTTPQETAPQSPLKPFLTNTQATSSNAMPSLSLNADIASENNNIKPGVKKAIQDLFQSANRQQPTAQGQAPTQALIEEEQVVNPQAQENMQAMQMQAPQAQQSQHYQQSPQTQQNLIGQAVDDFGQVVQIDRSNLRAVGEPEERLINGVKYQIIKASQGWGKPSLNYILGEVPLSEKEKKDKQTMQRLEKKEKLAKEQMETQARMMFDVMDTALKQIEQGNFFGQAENTGTSSIFNLLWGTTGHDLENNLSTLRANLTFDKLQRMRDASPTGGALGSVSDKELQLLADAAGSLSATQSKKQLIENLNRVRELYKKYTGVDLDLGTGAGAGAGGKTFTFNPETRLFD